MQEVWKDIPNFEGKYQISNLGNVKSLYTKRIKKLTVTNTGYYEVNLNHKVFLVHRLVATTFIDNPYNYNVVNHIDGNKLNNHFTNLEWCDYKHNNQHAFDNGLISTKRVYQYSLDGSFVNSFKNCGTASRKLNISQECIYWCCIGKLKSSGGYMWSYEKVNHLSPYVNNNASSKSKPVIMLKNNIAIEEFNSLASAKSKYGYLPSAISNVCLGKRKTAYGYVWRYKDT